MTIEKEWYNDLFPIGNSLGVRSVAAVAVGGSGGVLNLSSIFGPTGGHGGYYTAKADNVPSGHAIYIAAHTQPTYTLRPDAVDGATGMGALPTGGCWPLLNGQEARGRLPPWGNEFYPSGGVAVGYTLTGYRATLTTPNYLHYRGTPGMPTGAVLRIRRSTVPWTAGPGEVLKPPT